MQTQRIIAVKLIQEGKKVYVKLEEDGGGKGVQIESNQVPHSDLLKAVDSLRYHLPVLTSLIPEEGARNSPELANYVVTGYQMLGKEESQTIIVKGYRKCEHNTPVTLNPRQLLTQTTENVYPFLKDLLKTVGKIELEVRLYLSGEKKWEDPQMGIQYPNDTVTGAKILPPMNGLEKAKQETVDAYNSGEKPDPISPKSGSKKTKKVEQTAENKSGQIEE